MPIVDITDQFEDVNAYDRIYRSENGYTVKVRVVETSPTPSNLAWTVTGSWADDETGKARVFGDGHFIVEPFDVTVRADTVDDLAQRIENGRRIIVGRTEAAAINYAAREALAGVLKLPDPAPASDEPDPASIFLLDPPPGE